MTKMIKTYNVGHKDAGGYLRRLGALYEPAQRAGELGLPEEMSGSGLVR